MTNNKDMTKKNNDLKKNKSNWRAIDIAELERMRQPSYRRINKGLNWDADPIEKAKYEICQNILHYKQDNELSEREIGEKLGIKKQEKLEYLLFCHIDKFTLDKLVSYATKLLAPFELKIVRPEQAIYPLSPTKTNNRLRKQV